MIELKELEDQELGKLFDNLLVELEKRNILILPKRDSYVLEYP